MAAVKQHKLSARMRRTIGMIVATCMIAIASLLGSAGSASASMGACNGSLWNWHSDICVTGYFGGKDYRTHKQWVGWVESKQPGSPPREFMELWGDGFYYSGWGTQINRDVNRWVRSGTNVCAAVTDPSGYRTIACMAIKV
jgi:hypothetical protein